MLLAVIPLIFPELRNVRVIVFLVAFQVMLAVFLIVFLSVSPAEFAHTRWLAAGLRVLHEVF